MTKLLEEALEASASFHRMLRTILPGSSCVVPLSTDERAAIARSKSAAARGEFATDEQVQNVWTKHGR